MACSPKPCLNHEQQRRPSRGLLLSTGKRIGYNRRSIGSCMGWARPPGILTDNPKRSVVRRRDSGLLRKERVQPLDAHARSSYCSGAGVCANRCRLVDMHSAWEARIRRRFDFIERKGNGTQHSRWTTGNINTYTGTARVISCNLRGRQNHLVLQSGCNSTTILLLLSVREVDMPVFGC